MKASKRRRASLEQRHRERVAQVNARGVAFTILGPPEVSRAASKIPDAIGKGSQAVGQAAATLRVEMRKALGIGD